LGVSPGGLPERAGSPNTLRSLGGSAIALGMMMRVIRRGGGGSPGVRLRNRPVASAQVGTVSLAALNLAEEMPGIPAESWQFKSA
jgi:hypothetical protein